MKEGRCDSHFRKIGWRKEKSAILKQRAHTLGRKAVAPRKCEIRVWIPKPHAKSWAWSWCAHNLILMSAEAGGLMELAGRQPSFRFW